ncbi:Complex I subunit NDUFS6 [Prunus dulcis]|uniref:Complex I subunit NDUFS6 n=1 Tax=Prunus dulcis TaxID=3755 RepID=A0A4Y1QPT4_PRUDU|nr:Complex I subunit NDUFS6 [Prunus dulcis]
MYPWIDIQKCRHLIHQYLESTRGIGWGKDHRPLEFHGPKVEAVRPTDPYLFESGLMDDGTKLSLLGTWMALFVIFAGRKFAQPIKLNEWRGR